MSNPTSKKRRGKRTFAKSAESILDNGKFHWKCLQNDCPQNCCGPNFMGINQKGISLFKVNRYAIILTPQDKVRLEENIGKDYIETIDGRNYLKFKDDDSCFFLSETGMCKIHNIRPTGCKIFPLFLDKYWGVYVASSLCPGVGQGWTSKPEFLSMLRELVTLVDFQTEEIEHFIAQLNSEEGL